MTVRNKNSKLRYLNLFAQYGGIFKFLSDKDYPII